MTTRSNPQLKFTADNVASNRTAINARIAEVQAELAMLHGLHAANQSVCTHKRVIHAADPRIRSYEVITPDADGDQR